VIKQGGQTRKSRTPEKLDHAKSEREEHVYGPTITLKTSRKMDWMLQANQMRKNKEDAFRLHLIVEICARGKAILVNSASGKDRSTGNARLTLLRKSF